jgi:beta-lactamase class A
MAKTEREAGARLRVAVIDEGGKVIAVHRGDERFMLRTMPKVPLAGAIQPAGDRAVQLEEEPKRDRPAHMDRLRRGAPPRRA